MFPMKGYYVRAKVFGFMIVSILLFLLVYFLYNFFTT